MNLASSLMSRLGVKAVYWIDDENATAAELDIKKLIATFSEQLVESDTAEQKKALNQIKADAQSRKVAKDIERILNEDMDDHVTAVIDVLESRLQAVVPDVTVAVSSMLSELPQPLTPSEREGLLEVFQGHADWTVEPLSFGAWQARHAEILRKHIESGEKALLIVDLQNAREKSALSGKDVLAQWAQAIGHAYSSTPVVAIALTSKFKPENEFLEGRRFTKDLFAGAQAPSLPVLVVSKERLSADATTPKDAARAAIEGVLGRLRVCSLHKSLAEHLEKTFSNATKKAFERLHELSVEELLFSVSTTSYHEGTSEIDTLIRLASIAHRDALLNDVVANNEIASHVLELRGLQDHIVPLRAADLGTSNGIEELRCSELHDPPTLVNRLLTPLAAGDIFEVRHAGVTTNHVLVSNACDLTLRGNTGERKLSVGLLLELVPSDLKEFGLALTNFPKGSPLAERKLSVDFRRITTVPLSVLDLVWTNKEGVSQWSRDNEAEPDLALLPSQSRRYSKISSEWGSIGNITSLQRTVAWTDHQAQFANGFGPLLNVRFGIKRIGRLSTRTASELVQRFSQSVSRPTQDHNLLGPAS